MLPLDDPDIYLAVLDGVTVGVYFVDLAGRILFWNSAAERITGYLRQDVVAQELGKLPNKLAFEGHTDSKPYSEASNYTNWELSADRANAARRLMQQQGICQNQVTQVRGFADQRLRKINDPLAPSNRRIS
jgi:chemotaxis protein MotB